MDQSREKSKEAVIVECRQQITAMFNLVLQKRDLKPNVDEINAGVFQETGLYRDEFLTLHKAVMTLFQTVGTDETERIMEGLFSEFKGKLSDNFISNLSRLINNTASKIRSGVALFN